nr:hypothetical protein RKE32_32255 [Streptomyces sp. Li-HN-5-13]
MRKLVYYVAVSVDGFIAGPSGEFDFYPGAPDMAQHQLDEYPETIPVQARPQLGLTDTPNKHFDTVLMGLGAYRPGLDAGIPSPYPHLEQYVVSSTLPGVDDPAVHLVRADPLGLVRELKHGSPTPARPRTPPHAHRTLRLLPHRLGGSLRRDHRPRRPPDARWPRQRLRPPARPLTSSPA